MNSHAIGHARRHAARPSAGRADAWFAVTSQNGGSPVAAWQTHGRGVGLTDGPGESIDAIVERTEGLWALPVEVFGPRGACERFARRAASRAGARSEVRMELRLHRLDAIDERGDGSGRMRTATAAEEPLALEWMRAFARDVGFEVDESLRARVHDLVETGRLVLWLDGAEPVSMASIVRETTGTGAIGAVYSPPERRGRGHATGLVTALSSRILERGASTCVLYTDAANPTSNRLYRRIGYRPVAAFQTIRLSH